MARRKGGAPSRAPVRPPTARVRVRRARRRPRPEAMAAARWRPGRLVHGLAVLFWGVVAGALALAATVASMPDADQISGVTRGARLTILDTQGRLIAERGAAFGGDVRLEALPDHVIAAFLAAEDRRFYDHPGIDAIAVVRAMMANVAAGRVVQGGSTITQQLAKNLFLKPERTMTRKMREAALALWLETQLTKDEILALYLNRVYFGAGTYGIEAASQRYFAKDPRDLSLGEAALLAGLLKAPSRYAPTVNWEGAKARANIVLARMERSGTVSAAERRAATVTRTRTVRAATPDVQYFVDWVVDRLPGYIGTNTEDLIVHTTLDLAMQRAAERSLAVVLDGAAGRRAGQGALVALTPGGAVRAMVGGRSYTASPFNRATDARRQPGSAFKPVVYAAALELGHRPGDTIADAPVSIGDWAPENYTGRFEGLVTLEQALARSLNAATVRLAEGIGRSRIIDTAQRLGLQAEWQPVPSLPLGTIEVSLLELTGAYAPFANGGEAVAVNPVIRIETVSGRDLYMRDGSGLGQALNPDAAWAIDRMLHTAVAHGTGRAARLAGRPTAGKTGTSQDFRDAWFVGYTPGLVAGVWIGNDNNTAMVDVTGGTLPAQIWARFVSGVSDRLPVPGRPAPRLDLASRSGATSDRP